jgi:primosomal protein N' (replication factor Y)
LLLKLSSFQEELVEHTAFKLANYLQAYFQDQQLDVEVLGPAPASIYRVARRYRWQILLKRPLSPAEVTEVAPTPIHFPIEEARRLCPEKVRLGLDVDPQNLL